jgi:RimJ/RimL family protein N-acetyltransferase
VAYAERVLLETERLVLRRFRADDAEPLATYRSDPRVSRYQSWASPVTSAEATQLVDDFAKGDPKAAGWFQYAIERKVECGLIGDVGVCRTDDGRQAEIGFTLAPEHQRHGYAGEAIRAIVHHLLVDDKLHRVTASCDARNLRSARLLQRVGFRREGHLVASTWSKGEWTDDLLFALLADEWLNRS